MGPTTGAGVDHGVDGADQSIPIARAKRLASPWPRILCYSATGGQWPGIKSPEVPKCRNSCRYGGDLVPLGCEIAGDLVPEVANHRGYQIPVTPVYMCTSSTSGLFQLGITS